MRHLFLFIVGLLVWAPALAQEPEVSYKTMEPGQGRTVRTGDQVAIYGTLTLSTGELIQDMKENQPLTFELGATTIIPGLSLGMEGMKTGERRLIKVPPNLAYGPTGKGPIPPNAELVFEITLQGFTTSEVSLAEHFKNEEFLAARHADRLSKPAMFEYLIRDFFTKPWRYEDGHLEIWKEALKVFGLALFLVFGAWWGRRKGFWL